MVAAVHTLCAIEPLMSDRPWNDATERTLLGEPAIDVSSDPVIEKPTPTAKTVMPVARTAAAAAPGGVPDRPSVSTTSTLVAPARAWSKRPAAYVMATPVSVPGPFWYCIEFTALVTSAWVVPCEKPRATSCCVAVLYCTTATLVATGPLPRLNREVTWPTNRRDAWKLAVPTLPEPSTRKRSSTGVCWAHTVTGDGVGARVAPDPAPAAGAAVAAAAAVWHTVLAIDCTTRGSAVYAATESTFCGGPAIDVSSFRLIPEPTPTAKMVTPLLRISVAAAAGETADWPSVSTTRTFVAPGRAAPKVVPWTYSRAAPVSVPPLWYPMPLTAAVTAAADVPAARPMAVCCSDELLY
mmetsp:Transcript_760/g.2193  ORF Transcript_760/g.2193 Transcript_760/m.2193 type:complete len:353 (+) Transcript_760:1830-2888(+)